MIAFASGGRNSFYPKMLTRLSWKGYPCFVMKMKHYIHHVLMKGAYNRTRPPFLKYKLLTRCPLPRVPFFIRLLFFRLKRRQPWLSASCSSLAAFFSSIGPATVLDTGEYCLIFPNIIVPSFLSIRTPQHQLGIRSSAFSLISQTL